MKSQHCDSKKPLWRDVILTFESVDETLSRKHLYKKMKAADWHFNLTLFIFKS